MRTFFIRFSSGDPNKRTLLCNKGLCLPVTRLLIGCIIPVIIVLLLFMPGYGFASENSHGGSQLVDLGWRAANFVILVAILYFAAGKSIKNFFKDRSEGIKKELLDARQAKEDAERKMKDCLDKLANLEGEIDDIKGTLIREGKIERDRIIEAANLEAKNIKVHASLAAEQELNNALSAIRKESIEAALMMAEKILTQELKKADQERLVSDYLGGLRRLN